MSRLTKTSALTKLNGKHCQESVPLSTAGAAMSPLTKDLTAKTAERFLIWSKTTLTPSNQVYMNLIIIRILAIK